MKKRIYTIVALFLIFTTGCQTAGLKIPEIIKDKIPWPKTDEDIMDIEVLLTTMGCGVGTDLLLKKIGVEERERRLLDIGASAGCWILLNNYKNQLIEERKKLEERERDINARLEYARYVNKKTKEYNEHIEKEIGDIENKIKEKAEDEEGLKKVNDEIIGINKKIEEDKSELVKQLDDLKRYREELASENESKLKLAELDQELTQIESKLNDMDGYSEVIASLSKKKNV